MARFSDLPNEIWFQIAQYLSEYQLFELKSLNSFFLNCWMDHRWKMITISNRTAARLVQRMADPLVATRTKDLSINLQRSYQALVALPSLFRTIMSPSVARVLQVLSLTGHVEMFDLLGEYSAHSTFENLTALHLDLYSLIQTEISPTPFLCSLPSTLQCLSIHTTLNPFPLFDAFQSDYFPNLKHLHLNITLPSSIPFSSHSLRRFLLTHAHHLQSLYLNIKQKGYLSLLANLDNNSRFPSLQMLDIYPSNTQDGLYDLLTLIKRAPNLTSLSILTRDLTFEEATQLVNALTEAENPRNLKNLRMSLTQLSVPFLDLLARKLPQLEELSLDVNEIVGSDEYSLYQLLHHRRYNPDITCSQDVLHSWQLHSLSISQEWRDQIKAVHAIASVVPTLARKMGLQV